MSQILLKNGYVLTMNEDNQIYDGGSILIENDKIKAVGKVDDKLISSDATVPSHFISLTFIIRD